jgi:hypothetical protein
MTIMIALISLNNVHKLFNFSVLSFIFLSLYFLNLLLKRYQSEEEYRYKRQSELDYEQLIVVLEIFEGHANEEFVDQDSYVGTDNQVAQVKHSCKESEHSCFDMLGSYLRKEYEGWELAESQT